MKICTSLITELKESVTAMQNQIHLELLHPL